MKGSELTNLTEAFSGSPKEESQCCRCAVSVSGKGRFWNVFSLDSDMGTTEKHVATKIQPQVRCCGGRRYSVVTLQDANSNECFLNNWTTWDGSSLRGPAAWCSTHPRSAKALPAFARRACRSWRPSVTRNDRRKYILPLIINSSMKMSVYPFSKHPFMQADFAAHRPVIKWMTLLRVDLYSVQRHHWIR